jgi:hypothetical protein
MGSIARAIRSTCTDTATAPTARDPARVRTCIDEIEERAQWICRAQNKDRREIRCVEG